VARVGNASNAYFIGIASDPAAADETNIKNGRYIYGYTNNLSVYDIALNTYVNYTAAQTNNRGGTCSPTTWQGSNGGQDREFVYYITQPTIAPNGPNAIIAGVSNWRFNLLTQTLDPWGYWNLPITGSSSDPHVTVASYTDGGTTITWVYQATAFYYDCRMFRCLVIQ
jgi:hypothetical protein